MADTDFEWVGNELCLDFHNTASWDDAGFAGAERLDDFDALLAWCETSGSIDPAILAEVADELGEPARRGVLDQAYGLRAVIHDVFTAVARKELPSQENLEELNDFLASVLMRVEWAPGDEPVMASGAVEGLNELLAPVVWSAAALLVSPFRDKIGRCSNEECGWLFVDMSRRGNRRWCDMKACGNRAKASRHYERTKRAQP